MVIHHLLYSRVTLRVPIFQRTNMTLTLCGSQKNSNRGNPKSNETSSHDHFENVSRSKIFEVPDEINRCCHLGTNSYISAFQPFQSQFSS